MDFQQMREEAQKKLALLDTIELCFSAANPKQDLIPLGGLYELRRIIIKEYGDAYNQEVSK